MEASGAGEDERRLRFLPTTSASPGSKHLGDEELKDEYGMSRRRVREVRFASRTIRGFRDVRKIWNEALEPTDTYTDKCARKNFGSCSTDYKKGMLKRWAARHLDAMVGEKNGSFGASNHRAVG